MVDERGNDLCFRPLGLGEELVREAVPSSLVRRLDVGEVGLGRVEEGPELDQVVLDRLGNGRERLERLGLRRSSFGDALLLGDLLCAMVGNGRAS